MEEEEEKIVCKCCGQEVSRNHTTKAYFDGYYDYICDDCISAHFFYCEDCEEYYNSSFYSMYATDEGRTICESCRDDYYYACEDCGAIVHQDNIFWANNGDRPICSSCYGSNYFTCSNCDEIFENCYCNELNGNYYCDDCYREEEENMYEDERIGRYHYVQNNGIDWIPFATEREKELYALKYIGYELEVEPNRRGNNFNISKAIDSFEQNLNCVFEHDGSLNDGGFEVVSQPQTYDYIMEHYEDFKKAFKGAIDNGYVSHDSGNCGLHFHITAPTENREEIVNRLWYIIETYKEEFEKISRRNGSFSYCEFLSQYSWVDNKKLVKSLRKMKVINKDGERYLVINNTNSRTIEIRLFKGTLNVDTFFADLQLVHNLFELAYDLSVQLTDIDWAKLTQGEFIRKYCVENNIETDKKIVDNSFQYDLLEAKALRLATQIFNAYKKACVKMIKNIDFKVAKKDISATNIYNTFYDKSREISTLLERLVYFQRAIESKDLNNVINYSNYFINEKKIINTDIEKYQRKLDKIKEYYRRIEE